MWLSKGCLEEGRSFRLTNIWVVEKMRRYCRESHVEEKEEDDWKENYMDKIRCRINKSRETRDRSKINGK